MAANSNVGEGIADDWVCNSPLCEKDRVPTSDIMFPYQVQPCEVCEEGWYQYNNAYAGPHLSKHHTIAL